MANVFFFQFLDKKPRKEDLGTETQENIQSWFFSSLHLSLCNLFLME